MDESYDRNFVRHRLIPLLSERWPGASGRIAKSASLSRLASETLSGWADEKMEDHLLHQQVMSLKNLDPEKPDFAFFVRRWLKLAKAPPIPLKQLTSLSEQCKDAKSESRLKIAWDGWVIQYFQKCLWLQTEASISPGRPVSWKHAESLELGGGLGCVNLISFPAPWPNDLSIAFRKGGENFSLPNDSHHKALKDIPSRIRHSALASILDSANLPI